MDAITRMRHLSRKDLAGGGEVCYNKTKSSREGGERMRTLATIALSFAAGAMILVAVHELIPECQRNQKAQPYAATMGIVTGFALMMLLDVMLG